MKKLTCTLLLAIFTMTSMLFAQIIGDIVSDYFTITNKTTNESKKVPFLKFTSEGNTKSYDVDFCFGVYKGDEIEVTYTPEISINPQTAWSYSWNNGTSYDLGSASTAKLLVNSVPYNGSTLTFICNHLSVGISGTYNIRFKNVHNVERIAVSTSTVTKEVILGYAYYDELLSCANQGALAYLYKTTSEQPISSYHFERIENIGRAILSTGKKSGFYIVNVTVNDKIIFTRTIFVK